MNGKQKYCYSLKLRYKKSNADSHLKYSEADNKLAESKKWQSAFRQIFDERVGRTIPYHFKYPEPKEDNEDGKLGKRSAGLAEKADDQAVYFGENSFQHK